MISSSDRQILKRLWADWVLPHKAQLGLLFILMLVVALTGGAYPALISHVFDILAAGPAENLSEPEQAIPSFISLPKDPFIAIPVLIIAVAGLKAVAVYFQILNVNGLALRISTNIQKAMSAHLIDADLAVIMAEPAGAYISRIMNDLNMVREALVRLANNLVRDMLTILVMVGVMFWFSWLLSLLVLAVYPLAMRPIIRIGNRQRKASGDLQEHLEEVTALLGETLQGVRMVKAYQLEAMEKKRTQTAFDMLYQKLLSLLAGRARIDPILEALGGIAIAGVIAVAAWQVAGNHMRVGDVVGFITALLMLVQPVRAIGTLNAVVQEGLAAATRIFALLDRQNTIRQITAAPQLIVKKGHIQFEHVSFAYGDKPILSDISFEVAPGQTVALVGPSGGGKSSVINLLPRFYAPSSGKILIDGHDIAQVRLDSLRQQIALVSQEAVLFDDTIAANIGFGQPKASLDDVKKAAQTAAADTFIEQMEAGYHTHVGATGNRLSGGQKQRISIARALLKDAPILLLDEATSALDAHAQEQVQSALERLSKGRTTLIVAHRLSTISHADKIIVLNEGKISETGTHAALIAKNGLYAELCALQSIGQD